MPKGGFFGSNYSHIMEEMTPEALAGLLSDELYLNDCKFCSQREITPCDRRCFKSTLEWLNQPFDDAGKKLIEHFKTWEEIIERKEE